MGAFVFLVVVVEQLQHGFISLIFTLNICVSFRIGTFCGAKLMNKKIFRGAILESILLSLINDAAEHGLHGYAIFNAVYKKFGIRLGPSTLYAALRHLEKQGLVASSWEFTLGKARRKYRITRKGQSLLREYFAELKTVIPASVTYKP